MRVIREGGRGGEPRASEVEGPSKFVEGKERRDRRRWRRDCRELPRRGGRGWGVSEVEEGLSGFVEVEVEVKEGRDHHRWRGE